MNYMDGMTAAEEIRRLDPEVVIIFITNSPQYAIKGYQNLPVTAIAPGAFAGTEKPEGTEANMYVPAEDLSAYRTDYFWPIFGSRIRSAV